MLPQDNCFEVGVNWVHLAKLVLLYVQIALLERSVASWLHPECLSAGETGTGSNGLGDGMAVHGFTFARNAMWWSGPTFCERPMLPTARAKLGLPEGMEKT